MFIISIKKHVKTCWEMPSKMREVLRARVHYDLGSLRLYRRSRGAGCRRRYGRADRSFRSSAGDDLRDAEQDGQLHDVGAVRVRRSSRSRNKTQRCHEQRPQILRASSYGHECSDHPCVGSGACSCRSIRSNGSTT